MKSDLRLDSISVRWEYISLHHHLTSPTTWLVEAYEHEVEIDGQGIHHNHLAGMCTDDLGHQLRQLFVI